MSSKLNKAQRLLSIVATLALYLTIPAPVVQAADIPWDMTHIIDGGLVGATHVTTADLDGDGDLDVLGAGNNTDTWWADDPIAWWENNGSGGGWTRHAIDATLDGVREVGAADLNGDGDLDVLVIAQTAIAWWENDGSGGGWIGRFIATGLDRGQEVHAADMDNDGDLDVLGIGYALVAYWENNGPGTWWTQRTIATAWDIRSGCPADLDGDGDTDVLAGIRADGIEWWENDRTLPDDGVPWTQRGLPSFDRPSVVRAADVDSDGDLDVLGASAYYDQVHLYRNDGGGTSWSGFVVGNPTDPHSLHAADMDEDGDLDAVGAGTGAGTAGWWENTTGAGTAWTYRQLTSTPGWADAVHPADLDGDGDLDVVAASSTADTVAWWENETIHRNAIFPAAGAHTIDGAFYGVESIYAADVDGDGDTDVLGAAWYADDIAWWENTDGAGLAWTKHTVDGNYNEAISVYGADVDGDGDTDVLGASSHARGGECITWWENLNGAGTAWTQHVIEPGVWRALWVHAADVDGDGDTDVLGAAIPFLFNYIDDVTWWENTNGAGTAWTEHRVDRDYQGTTSVYAADVDGDGDTDVLGAGSTSEDITWWENTGPCNGPDGDCTAWTEHTVDGSFPGSFSVNAADVDGDGDTDILGASNDAHDITWWENTNGIGTAWTERTVDGAFSGAYSVNAADVDGDGDTDVLGGGSGIAGITWWENTNGAGTAWTEHTTDGNYGSIASAHAADVDGDGDTDVLGGGSSRVTWWENRGGQFGLDTTATAPVSLGGGEVRDLLRVTVRHNGRAGDGDIELTSLALLFEESAGDPLTSAEANALVANLHIYRDNGSGVFEATSDALVTSVDTLTLSGGVQTVTFADGDPNVQVTLGTPRTFFVVVELTADAAVQTPFQLRVTHLTQSGSSGQDRDHDLPLSLEYAPNTGSGVTVFRADTIYLAPDVPTCAGFFPCVTTSQRVLDRLIDDGTLVVLDVNDIPETVAGTGRDVTVVGRSGDVLHWDGGAGALFTMPGPGTVTLSGTLTLSCTSNCAGSTAFLQSGGTLSATHSTITGFDTAFDQIGGTLIAHTNVLSGTGTAFASSGTATVYGNTITGFDTGFRQSAGTLIAHTNVLSGTGTAFVSSGMATAYGNTITGSDTGFRQSAGTLIAHTNVLSGTGTAFVSSGMATVYSNTVSGSTTAFSQTSGTLTAYGNALSGNGTGIAFASGGTATVHDNTATGFAIAFDHTGTTLLAHDNVVSGTTTAFRLSGSATVYGNTAIGYDTAFDLSDATLTAYANNLSTPDTALAWTGSTWNLKHNWWGTALESTPPAGLDQLSWLLRLGAPVEGWASGDGGAALGGAELAGGTGTAVIVSHGRGPADAPFGVEVAPPSQMCSDYYDFFTVGGAGVWTVNIPVDDNPACDAVYIGRELLWALDTTQCTPGSTTCYDPVPVVGQEAGPPRQLVFANVPTNYLYGTLFVAGSEDDNDPPTAVDDTATTDEDSPVTIDVLTNDDDDGGTPVVAGSDAGSAQGQVTDNGDGTFDYDPNGQFEHLDSGEQATDTFTYVVSDGTLTDTATVTITVTGVNDGPIISDISHQLIRPGTLLGPVSFGVDDVDDAPGMLALTGTSSNPALVDDSSIGFGGYGANRTIALAPSPGVTGTATITVTVSDGDLSTHDTFMLSVEANSPPEFTCSPVTAAAVGALYVYTITVRDLDADDALTITATTKPDWLSLTQVTSRTATLSGTPAGAGSHPIILQATDGEDADTQSFTVESTSHVYLPVVLSSYATAPDLVVARLIATPDQVQVVVRNAGNAPVVDDFWVDGYIAPHTVPSRVNQTWNALGDQGLVWGVTADLDPGEAITLTVGGAYYVPEYSHVTWPLPAGTPVYVQVDSADADSSHGAVLELHEILGRPYNNVAGTYATD